jgi:AraC family transcriptional regulator
MDIRYKLLFNGMANSNFRAKHAIAIILHNLNDDELSVNVLASSLRISPSHLRRIVLDATDMTPGRLIKHCRLERARELLMGVLSIKEISHSVGIRDVSHFVRDFKAKYGIRPTEYRRRMSGHLTSTAPIPNLQYAMPPILVEEIHGI